jgi:hypothetical protein
MLTHHLDTTDDRLIVEQHLRGLHASAARPPRRGGTLRLRRRLGHGLVGLGLRVAGEPRGYRVAPR